MHVFTKWLFAGCVFLPVATAIELTFELPDNAKQCFYEDIREGTESTVEFQVVTGGQYDVDLTIESPTNQILYQDIKKQYDAFTWKADFSGTYSVCFSNEFSTFSHKVVYMDWQVGDSDEILKAIEPQADHFKAMTQMESSAQGVHERLKKVEDYQTHHRLRESTSRKRAEDLNERILWWSAGETIVIVLIGISQVVILRSFFRGDKRPMTAGVGRL